MVAVGRRGRHDTPPPVTSQRPGSLGRDSLALFVGNVILRGSALLAIMILTRILTPTAVGVIVFAQAVVAYLVVAMEFGWTTAGIGHVARDPAASRRVLGAVLVARTAIGIFGVLLIVVVVAVMPVPQPLGGVLILYGLAAGLGAFDVTWVSQALGSTVPRALLAAIGGLLGLAVTVGLALAIGGPESAALGALVAALVVALAAIAIVVKRHGPPARPAQALFRGLGRSALPLGLSSLLAQVYYNFDLILLGVVRTATEVAVYGAVYKVVLGLQLIWLTFASVSLPRYSAAYAAADGSFESRLAMNTRLLGAFAIPVAIGGTILAEAIVTALFGPGYASGAIPLALLLWAVMFAALHSTAIAALSVSGRGWVVTRAILIGAAANVVANLLLTPRYGMVAAAGITVATELVVLVLVAARLPSVGVGLRGVLRSVPPALAMAVGLVALTALAPDMPVLASITIGALVYLVAGLSLRSWPSEDRHRVEAAIQALMGEVSGRARQA